MRLPSWFPGRESFRLRDAAAEALEQLRHRGPALRRAARLCSLGDALRTTRPRRWQDRSRRAYVGVLRRLGTRAGQPDPAQADPATMAHAALRSERVPYRRFWAALAWTSGLAAAGVLVLALLLAAVAPPFRHWMFPPNLAANAPWKASSAFPGLPSSGKGPSSKEGYFVHTGGEDHPWVQIELPRVARVRKVRIQNRGDCCGERTLPLNVEVPDGKDWRLICQRRAPFSTWTCHPPPTATKVLRVVIPGASMLHLKSVAVYE